MKTVITDNSLSVLPISDTARPEHIYRYIEAIGEIGVKYVELDYSTVMKMNELPDNVKYIFRLQDPIFTELTDVFDFSYTLITLDDLKQRIRVRSTPLILELPAAPKPPRHIIDLARNLTATPIEMIRMRGSFDFMSYNEAAKYVYTAKSTVPMPIDICPMNKRKNALDCAMKFSRANVDCLTMCVGLPHNYASVEEFLFGLMSVHETMLKEYNMAALCKAAIYHQLVFDYPGCDSISYIMELLDKDILNLRNVDTGKRVRMKVQLKDKAMLRRHFVSALENFINNEEIPDDFAYDINEAIKRFDTSLYNEDISYTYYKDPLN